MSYSTGTVYKIICRLDSDIVYIGSTFNSLRNRWQHHRSNYGRYLKAENHSMIYPYFEKYGIENFKIIKIKEYKCYRENRSDRRHLNVYETLWINKTKCVNKVVPFCIKKLSKKQYREENKEKIRSKKKEPKLCIICKNNITNSHFKRHSRTPKHIRNAQQIIYNFMCR